MGRAVIAEDMTDQDLRDRVWPTGVYIRTGQGWFASSQDLRDGSMADRLILFGERGRDRDVRPPSDAREVRSLSTEGLYHGQWLGMGTITDADGVLVHTPAPRGAANRFAHLFYAGGEAAERIAQLPGATLLDPRGSNGGIVIPIRLSDLTDHRTTVRTLRDAVQE